MKNLRIICESNIKLGKKILHSFIGELKSTLNFDLDFLQVNFVNSDFIFQLNKKYLDHERTTDIITFPFL